MHFFYKLRDLKTFIKMRLIFILASIIFYGNMYSQQEFNSKKNLPFEVSTLNVSHFDLYLNEVYLTEVSYLHLNNSKHYNNFLDIIQNRISVSKIPFDASEKYENTLHIPLLNTYNSKLKYDAEFDIITFNPFKYQLNFFSKYTKIYRIAHSDYILVINPIK